ncbi:MAG: response regulator [Maricaulaceae bacterium]|nr:response regulator [Maricaulaceae bacterium]
MSDAADHLSETPKEMRAPMWARPAARFAFWAGGFGALAAAGMALFAASAAGWHGFVLLSGVAAVAFLLLYALAAGEAAGRGLRERAERADAAGPPRLAFEALESLADPVLITDRKGAPRWGNAAWRELVRDRRLFGQSLALPGPERLWAGVPGADGAIYRLSRSAAIGQARRERLPALPGVDGGSALRFDAEARPSGVEHLLWRLTLVRPGGEGAPPAGIPGWADQAPAALFALDGDGRIIDANATFRDWLGLSAGDSLPPLQQALAGDGARAVMRTRGAEGVARVDARLKAREGVETPVVLALEWEDGKAPLARAVMYGLSATGAPPGLAQTLKEAGRRAGGSFDEMFANAPFGVARLDGADPETAIVEDANAALLKMCGGAATPGVRFSDLFDWSDGRSVEEAFAAAGSGRGEPGEVVIKGDPRREAHLVFAPARGGKRAAYVIDVTDWKELERQMSQGAKLQSVGQLAGGVAHDFNNLLQAIRLNTDELLGRHPVGDPSYAELQAINQTVARAAGLVRKLLAFSRKQTFRVETLDLPDMLSDCSALLRQILEESVRLEIVHGRDVPAIRADKGQLETAIVNLAVNARDAMRGKGGGTLSIRTARADGDAVRQAGAPEADGDWVMIEVTDEGCGMDAETRAKIFEPFFTTKAPGHGTGLGLATVYGIVKQSGGYLFVDSEPGRGSTFRIFLPAHHPAEEERAELARTRAEAVAEKPPADLAGRGRILLVEDEDAVRAIAAKTLAKRGYEVVEAADGEEALDILCAEDGGFDLLITDVVMPGLDGPGLLEKARDRLGSTRVVFISGYAEEQFSETLSREKNVSFLPKPFTLVELAERVKAELNA